MLQILARLKEEKIISAADFYFARFIAEKSPNADYPQATQNLAVLLAALCSFHHQQGNTCLFLTDNKADFFDLSYRTFEHNYLAEIQQSIEFLPMTEWQAALRGHPAFTAQPAEKIAPLVFQFNAVYFYRVWQDEFSVADYLLGAIHKSAVQKSQEMMNIANIREILNILFPDRLPDRTDWQKVAVATALKQPFCLISGGPGTGKTHTVAGLLVALQWLQMKQNLPPLRIKLVAPTGKASARLTESITNALENIKMRDDSGNAIGAMIPAQAATIHRLLGVRPFDDSTRFNRSNRLPADVLVVDEASMIDLSLMAKLLNAMPANCRLILLGDKDQLASVEAGAIIGELGQFITQIEARGYSPQLTQYLNEVSGENLTPDANQESCSVAIGDYLCSLRYSYRFHEASGIGHLARAVNAGQARHSWQLFGQYEDIRLQLFDSAQSRAQQLNIVIESAVENYSVYLNEVRQIQHSRQPLTQQRLNEIFNAFKKVRFLTALRTGYFGVEKLNQAIAERLRQKGLVYFKQSREWYAGKPVMVTENDANTGIYNGDIGLFLTDEQGRSKVWFEQGENQYKSFSASRVPSHETGFVMTVHKSQGSEFEHTFFVLPDMFFPVLSKELVYTAITRAKQQLTVFAQEKIWKSAVRNPIKRQSGLAKLLSPTPHVEDIS